MKVIIDNKFIPRLRRLADAMGKNPNFAEGRYYLSEVVREATLRGLEVLEKEAGASLFSVQLINHGMRKINCIKAIRAITGLGLKEAKDVSERTPIFIREGVDHETAKAAYEELVLAGAVAKILPG
jgi:ribosomal protein L7/L12